MKIINPRFIITAYIFLAMTLLPHELPKVYAAGSKEIFDNAFAAMQQGKPEKARGLYEKALEINPDSCEIWLEYTSCLRKTKHYQRAVMAGWKAIELDSKNYGCWGNLGNVFLECQAWQQAYDAFRHAEILCNDKTWSSHNFLNMGYSAMQNGDTTSAAKAIEHALLLDPSSRLARIDYALLLGITGNTDKAKNELIKALETKPANQTDNQTIEFGKKILETLEKNKQIDFPEPFATSTQLLPSRFLNRPGSGQVLRLAIDKDINRIFSLGKSEYFSLRTPETWDESLEIAKESFYTIKFNVPENPPCWFLLTPMPVARNHYNSDNIQKDVRKMGEILMPHATDKELVLFSLPGDQNTFGYSFTITDKNWKPGREEDFPHATQGIMVIDGMPFTFTILSHSRDKEFIERYLGIAGSIKIVKKK